MRLIERANGFMNSPDKYFEWEKMKLVHDLKSKVEEMQKTMADGEEMLRELYSQIGQDIDINPSAKRVYLSKVEYVGNYLLRQSLKGGESQ